MPDYKILRVIGKGAFGDAYLGLNVKQNKQYVIKQVQIKNKSKQQTDHIYHEVKLLQQFNHINIVSYRDSYIDKKGLLNIVMQYCQGGDMNQYIESLQGNKIQENKIVYWMAQIALAIFYMHQKKILHRDLKSPNIFILKGNIRLGDFGISKVLDHVRDLAQTNIGTPYYMSPQQYNHKPYSYKSDIWAFGCILYEMCNQRRPFQANNIQALGMKVVRGNFPPVSECYSKDLRNLISQMLSKNPTKRPNIIQILLKPFIKKKLVEYMRTIYLNKQQISKQSYLSFLQQAKKLGVQLQQNKSIVIAKPILNQQKQRSNQINKNKKNEEDKQKQKLQRQRKKQQLQKQLKKHNKQRKQMAQKLKKIQQQRKNILARKKSQKNLKSIYQKVQSTSSNNAKDNINLQRQYKSEKYSVNSSNVNVKVQIKNDLQNKKEENNQKNKKEDKNEKNKKEQNNQKNRISSSNNDKKPSNHNQKSVRKISPVHEIQTPATSVSTQRKLQKDQQNQKVLKDKWIVQPQKAFKMQQEYEMQFQDCQPEDNQNQQNYYDQFDQYQQSQKHIESHSKYRLPTFANDQNILAKQVEQIKNLVLFSNQAVKQLTKNQPHIKQNLHQINQKKQILQKGKVTEISSKHKQVEKQKNKTVQPLPQNIIVLNQQQKIIVCEKIQQKVQKMKQQIKMKTQHINSIRNQLSNIDFQLSDSDNQVQTKFTSAKQKQAIQISENFNRKKAYNPQHTKINDRINTLKQSAMTILGSQKYNTFYEYLFNITQKGRNVKRQYLQAVLGKQKIGSYHLVQQIVRLNRVLQKIPKWII